MPFKQRYNWNENNMVFRQFSELFASSAKHSSELSVCCIYTLDEYLHTIKLEQLISPLQYQLKLSRKALDLEKINLGSFYVHKGFLFSYAQTD